MDENKILLEFAGPYSWRGRLEAPSIFNAPIARKKGLYLWTVSIAVTELIYYVGETGRDFGTRMLEHFREHCSGGYHIYSPVEFRRGEKLVLWPGRYDADARKSVGEFIEKANELWPALYELIDIYRFYCAPLESDQRTRQRIEAGIAQHLYDQDGQVGAFQDRGIRYRPRTDKERPINIAIHPWDKFQGLASVLEA